MGLVDYSDEESEDEEDEKTPPRSTSMEVEKEPRIAAVDSRSCGTPEPTL